MQDKSQVGAKNPYRPRQKWFLDDRGRKLIMDLYDGTTERVTLLEKELRVPRKVVKRWAGELGVARKPRDINWSIEEIAYLEKHYHRKSMVELSNYLKRSIGAIKYRATMLGLRSHENYTGTELKEAFGCKYERIQMWIAKGWIKGFRREKDAQRGDAWQFTEKAIRDFIIAHPNELDQRRVDWLWIIDILAGERGLGRLDESYERGKD